MNPHHEMGLKSEMQGTTVPERNSPVRRIFRWLGRGILGLVISLAALIVSGIAFESVAVGTDGERFPVPGQLVVLDGRTMHLKCTGTGPLTVVLEAGSASWSDSWALVQSEVSRFARVCSYDRAGLGWSEPHVETLTPGRSADQLYTLLKAAGETGPYLLVAHSSGSRHIRLFAARHPDAVAGLVFVDGRHESLEPQLTPEENLAAREAYEASLGLYRTLRQLGIARLFGLSLGRAVDPSLQAYPDEVAYRMVYFSTRETTLQTMMAESRYSTADDEALAAIRLAESLPIIVLTAESSLENPGWADGQAKLAALSSNSASQMIAQSGHNLPAERPEAIANAIEAMIAAIQKE